VIPIDSAMAISEPNAPAPPRAEEQEPPYEGARGRTRFRSVHVTLPSGFVRLVQVYDGVNVATDPHLKEPALAGALHRFETGESLAIPFVYHDPAAHKLALVIPTELRHEELSLRAKLLGELAEDDASPIPSYAAEATTVVGIAALKAYLERQNTSAALSQLDQREKQLAHREAQVGGRENAVEQREKAVQEREQAAAQHERDVAVKDDAFSQREARLQARAEQVTRREDELRMWAEELEAARADLRMQEQELEARFEMLHQREGELAQRAEASGSTPVAAPVNEGDVVQLTDDDVQAVSPAADDVQAIDDDLDEIEELDDLQPLETNPAASANDLASEVQMVDPGVQPVGEDDVEEIVDDVEEIEEIEELEELEPIEDVTGVHAEPTAPLEASATVIADVPKKPVARLELEDVEEELAKAPKPSVPPPPQLDQGRWGAKAIPSLVDDVVRIHAYLPAGKEDRFAEGEAADLLVQLVVVEERPVVLLSIVEQTDSRPTVLRAPLDPREDDGKEILEHLRRDCSARVALHDGAGTYLRTIDASGPRGMNALRILERVSKMRTAAAVDLDTAIERVLGTPPPVSAKDHPFLPESERKPAADAAAAKKALDEVEQWASHEKMDRAMLGLSIPADDVDGTVQHVLEDAIRFGLPLTPRLREHSLLQDIEPDPAALVERQIVALIDTTKKPDRSGLSVEEAATAWETLLDAAAEAEYAIDTDTHEHAWSLIRKVRGGDVADVDAESLPKLSSKELLLLLEHPKYRRDAAIELASRKEPEHAERLCKAVRKMPRSEVVRVVPQILALGDEAGDALIDGLNARKTFVRQAFALSLGHLGLRRAVVPLLHLLASEQSDVWREVARVLGGFGKASFRTVSRQLKDPKGPQERYVTTLAHLIHHGCEKDVDKLTKDSRPAVATMAVEALTLRQEAKTIEDRALGTKSLPGKDPILQFSRRFYEEIEGKAPSEDLED